MPRGFVSTNAAAREIVFPIIHITFFAMTYALIVKLFATLDHAVA
jgi:hypothetical protein